MRKFKIDHLDHVAIRVASLKQSVEWYSKNLGLNKYQFDEWGEFPIFMLSGQSGIALFPNSSNADMKGFRSVDHFAFYVNNENFKLAQEYFNQVNITFTFQDHYYFHSIYLKDPDNHTVELTTRVKELDYIE